MNSVPMGRIDARVEGMVAAASDRIKPVDRFGWAFLLAWVFCMFYLEPPALQAIGIDDLGFAARFAFDIMPVACSAATLVVILALCRESPLGSKLPVKVMAPIATAGGTLLYCLGSWLGAWPVSLVGMILEGFGSACMWVLWGESYADMGQEEIEFVAPASVVLGMVIVFLALYSQLESAIVLVVLMPLVSGACLVSRSLRAKERSGSAGSLDAAGEAARVEGEKAIGRTGIGIMATCAVLVLAPTLVSAGSKPDLLYGLVPLAGAVFALGIAHVSTVRPGRISLAFLYRWTCPALVCAMVVSLLFPLGGPGFSFCAYTLIRLGFLLMTQMFFAIFAQRGFASPTRAFGIGWLFVHIGDIVGLVLVCVFESPALQGIVDGKGAMLVVLAALVVATMFVLNDRRSFSTGMPEGDGASRLDAVKGASVVPECAEPASQENREDVIGNMSAEYHLTARETEVLRLLAAGRSIPYVRDALVISKETAATHAKHIYQKLDVHSRQELIDMVQKEMSS